MQIKNKTLGSKLFDVFNTLFMIFMIIITAYPIYFVLIASFSDPASLMANSSVLLMPIEPFTLQAYEMVFDNPMIMKGFFNSVFLVVVGVSINMVMTIIGAYFLACKDIMHKNIIVVMIIITMYFSGGMIPAYLNIRDLGMLNTYWALIIPGAIATGNMIIMRTAFQGIPDSLIESAGIDGASHITILFKIMVPLAVPTIAVLVLYYGVGHWNSWFSASIYLQDRALYPLQLIMREILILNQTESMLGSIDIGDMAQVTELIKYALIVVTTAPILVLYPFLQKYFIYGMYTGSVKE